MLTSFTFMGSSVYGVLLRKRTGKLSDFKVGAGEWIQAREKEGFLRETPPPQQ